MSAPEISVVMANHNGAPYLAFAIRSLLAQTWKSWELLLVDDASDDGSVQLATRFAREDSRIIVVEQKANCGPAAARNRALSLARGHWMAVFDSDDLMQPRRLELLRERAKADGALIVADNLMLFSGRNPIARPFLPKRLTAMPRWISFADYVDSSRLFVRTPDLGYLKPFIAMDLLRRSGQLYDEGLRIGEDYDFVARLLARGLRLRLEPSGQYLYRKHSSSTSHRIQGSSIAAMIQAHDRLVREIGSAPPEAAHALARRRKCLISMLLYDQVIAMLKAGRYADALGASLAAPRIWPLLASPIRARIRRLRRKIAGPRVRHGATPLSAD